MHRGNNDVLKATLYPALDGRQQFEDDECERKGEHEHNNHIAAEITWFTWFGTVAAACILIL